MADDQPSSTAQGTPEPGSRAQGAHWFAVTCRNTRAHTILAQIANVIAKGAITQVEARDVLLALADLREELARTQCPLLCAEAIQVIKGLVSVKGAENLHWGSLSCVSDIWIWGRRYEQSRLLGQQVAGPLVFDPATFLEGWKTDLPSVSQAAYPWYVKLLGCEQLPPSPNFKGAVAVLTEHLDHNLPADATGIADGTTRAFVMDVLEPLLDTNLSVLLDNLPAALRLFALALRLASSPEGLESVDKIEALLRNIRARGRKESLEDAHKVLNALFCKARGETRKQLARVLSRLIPMMLNYTPRGPRRLAQDCRATIRVHIGGVDREFPGTVFDLCDNGNGCLVMFDDIVTKCESIPRSEAAIPGTSVVSRDILVTQRHEDACRLRDVVIRWHVPGGGGGLNVECDASSLRGWNYADEQGTQTLRAGAVFWFRQEPEAVTRYREQLPYSLGGEAEDAQAPQGAVETRLTIEEKAYLARVTAAAGGQEGLPRGERALKEGIFGLTEGVQHTLAQMADTISLRKGWEHLWDRGRPVEERLLGAYVRDFLGPVVESRGAVFAPQADTGRGPCDYLVARGLDRVYIELKPSYGAWRQGIDAQLITYINTMDEHKAGAGVFLVLAFGNTFRPKSPELGELLERRDAACSKAGVMIDVAVINCDKGESGSKEKAPAIPGEALHYFECKVPQRPASLGLPAAQQVLPDTLPQMPEVGPEPMPPAP